MQQEGWTVFLLDGLRAIRGGVELTDFGTRQNNALLAYLAHDKKRQHRRELLIEMLWPSDGDSEIGSEKNQSPDAQKRNRLSRALSDLRQLLEVDAGLPKGAVIVGRPKDVQLNPAFVTVDVDQFEDFQRQAKNVDDLKERSEWFWKAANLYQQDLFDLGVSEEEEHYSARRSQLSESYDLLLIQAAEASREVDNMDAAISYARKAKIHNEFSEGARRLLIRLYFDTGEMAMAVKECDSLENMCMDELKASPSEQSAELIRQIRSSQPILPLTRPTEAGSSSAAYIGLPALRFTTEWDHPITPLIGREDDIERLRGLLVTPADSAAQRVTLSASRLVTLTGLGGIGKTRLALEAAQQLRPTFQGRVIFLPLAGIIDVSMLSDSLADALGIKQPPADRVLERIRAVLGDNPVLLVLDRLEHLLPGIGRTIRNVLHRLPAVTCLATSRVVLGVEGELPFPVQPLPVPDSDGPRTPQELLCLAGVRLFVSRRPGCEVNAGNADVIAGICCTVEGIPFALEVAAGAAGLSLKQVLSRLQKNRFDPAVSRRVDNGDGAESVLAAISSSFGQLPTALRLFLKRLTVFEQGWSVEAAEAVCEEPLAETHLLLLRDRSLVTRDEKGGELRYRMLDTVRDFGHRKLRDTEKSAIARRHAEYLLWWLNEDNSPPDVALRWVAQEQGNFQAALRWCLDDEADADLGLRIASRAAPYWQQLQQFSKARRWLEKACRLSRTVPVRERANALGWAGILAAQQGDFDIAIARLEEGQRLFTEPRDRVHLAGLLNSLGNAYAGKGDFLRARAATQESITIYQEEKVPIAAAQGLMNLGNQSEKRGDFPAAEEYHKLALSIQLKERSNPNLQDPYGVLEGNIAGTIMNMGNVALAQGHYKKASSCYEESFQLSKREGGLMSMATARHNQGTLAYVEGKDHEARQHYLESLNWRRELEDMSGTASTLSRLALLDCQAGDYSAAAKSLTESLGIAWRIDERETVVHALKTAAHLAAAEGHPEWSARLWGCSDLLREDLGLRELDLVRDREADFALAAASRSFLGTDGFEQARSRGRELPLEDLIIDALKTLPVLAYKMPEAGASGD